MAEVEKVLANPEVTGYVLTLDPEEAADLYAVLNADSGGISELRVDNPAVCEVCVALEDAGL